VGKDGLVWKNAHDVTHDISLLLPVSMAAVHEGYLLHSTIQGKQ